MTILSKSSARKFQSEYSALPISKASSLRSIFNDDPAPSPSPSPTLTLNRKKKQGRIYPGSRFQDIYSSDPFTPPPPFSSFSTSFSVSNYLDSLILHDPTQLNQLINIPIHTEIEVITDDSNGPQEEVEIEMEVEEVEELVWIYESLRKILKSLQFWFTRLQFECSSEDDSGSGCCSEMRAREWLYICVAHDESNNGTTNSCTALSYISHVLQGSSTLLTSIRYFPSRISLRDDDEGVRSLLKTVSRRLYRCFSHTYFHHGRLFEELENETWLLRRFVLLIKRFNLIDQVDLIIPELNDDDDDDDDEKVQGEEEEEEGGGGIRLVE